MGMLFIQLQFADGTVIVLDYTKTEDKFMSLTVGDTKDELVRRYPDIRKENIQLYYGGKKLESDDTQLIKENITSECQLLAVKVLPGDRKKQNVKFLDKTYEVMASLNGLIIDFKESIREQLHIPYSLQILKCNGQAIDQDDFQILESKGVTPEGGIELELKTHMQSKSTLLYSFTTTVFVQSLYSSDVNLTSN